MKNLRTLVLSLILLFGSAKLKAAPFKLGEKLSTIKEAVNTYISAIAEGYIKNFGSIVDQNLKFLMLGGKSMLSFTKAEILTFLMENQNLNQGCIINTSLINNGNELAVVKFDMVYPDFTRTNYVTLVNTANGWKINAVYSVSK
ncbi:nuclear transport factor 2 family protein [Mucilaginibacter sp. McL0603]|uniref:nuclear transport factor 2 family protein n=1 Tax=Mucilaginibacter sp. McL0603 TaxID=3415670 RepID=UPI003CF71EA8